MNAQIKLFEMWKSINLKGFPLKTEKRLLNEKGHKTRSYNYDNMIEPDWKPNTLKSFISDATRLWNQSPTIIKNCDTVHAVKKAIRNYVEALPM